ncbi:hypothetical protein A3C67_03220 [Candidatus Nomurabacteria bacterium RIFCSPHIGHO2_02_FULL_42_19]|uniref:Uncharacterized protein n=1 Tax=Candidatus Nomurabacteria bacterium RIFCSPHIGHO2_02_FULL_42_19 TaxID=1801756 RepID=A0A1F6W2R2_9BACT|nr:MAG: hypothetical protein A3C67_03220 [Candidatus Nomurabacteria bacterium RIFCSPHIGHO2_02_FULL_42_19]
MRKIIHRLRRQPEHIRTYVLHALTIVAGVILFSLWVYSLGTDLTAKDTQAELKNDLQPFSALKDNLIGGYNSIIGQEAAPAAAY